MPYILIGKKGKRLTPFTVRGKPKMIYALGTKKEAQAALKKAKTHYKRYQKKERIKFSVRKI